MQAAEPRPTVAPEMPEVPDLSMTKGEMLGYAAAHGITLTGFLTGKNGTKHDVLEAILEELDARKAANPVKDEEAPEE
ncbi:MAG: hypothetical protein ACKVT1_01215 [Dehalococcoidia bacterium]